MKDTDLFVCEKCGCVDQVRTGWYPIEEDEKFTDARKLCCACGPTFYNGLRTHHGTWHNKFMKKSWADWGYPKVLNKTDKDMLDDLSIL